MRKLTGEWYLKKKWFGYVVMVQCVKTEECPDSLDQSPEYKIWEKARPSDLYELDIRCV